ncbi:putative disease resistance RPP13-like protein 1 [Vitis vinifera]|uniref:Putative disease resistance RPP13-like protein 1 n=1 Tax=Vitis vinifera TaxID=29760 RepID=A0A438FID1_VITVI|nr:putative disease resistance RPP13-like protein 1 [Vitis vinifera]
MLRNCSSLDELPSKMGKLIILRYLDVDGCSSLREMLGHGIGRLKSLQRLTRFIVGQNNGLRIGELGELSEIRGKLHISNMENVVSVNDASRANMKDKSYLDELIFDWGYMRTSGVTQSGATTHNILNKLQPHPNLKQLSIRNYPGEGFPNWLGDPSVLNLVSLELRGCGNCSTLPPLGQLTQLKYLQISRMNGVECVGDELYGNASFQFLETLSFEDMKNWEKWLCCGEFPRLQKLFIRKCPKLTGKLPEQLLSLVELQIDGCPQLLMASLTVPAIRQLRMVDFGKLRLQMPGCDFTALQTSEIEILDASQWSQLPMAPHQLSIRKCDYVESLLKEEISQTNIDDLKIYDCSFSRSLHNVCLPTTLKSLFISECSKLEILVPELFRCHLPVLERLRIEHGVIDDSLSLSFSLGIFPKLTDFKIDGLKGLEKLSILVSEGDPTSLCSLSLDGCPNLESIELHALNLESCSIDGCSKLSSLAHAHSSIQELYLCDCPELLFQREGLPSNLRKLEIGECNQLTAQVEWGLQRLTSLTHFKIKGGCEDIGLFPKECLLPSSLTSLQIESFPDLKSLDSGGLQHLTSLEIKFFRCLNSPLVQQLAVIGGHVKCALTKWTSAKEEGRFLGARHLMLIALFKKTKKLRGSVSEIAAWPMARLTIPSTVKQFLMSSYINAENLLLGPNGLWKLCNFGSTSTNHKHFKKPEEMGIEEDNIRKCGDLFRRKPINEKVDIWHGEKIEATDWELQQRKSVSPGPDSNLWQAFSEAGAQTTIAKSFTATPAAGSNISRPSIGGNNAQLFVDSKKIEGKLATQPAEWAGLEPKQHPLFLKTINGHRTILFGIEVVSGRGVDSSSRFMFASLHTAMISKSLNVPIPVDLNQSLRSDSSQWGNWRKGRFLGAELLMFIALFKKNKKLLNPGIELMPHNVLLQET